MFWFLVALLFVLVTALFILKKESWPYLAIIVAVISQILILTVWHNAKFGTIANVIIILAAVATLGNHQFETRFTYDVKFHLLKNFNIKTALLTQADIQHLPIPVQKHSHYCQILTSPKLKIQG